MGFIVHKRLDAMFHLSGGGDVETQTFMRDGATHDAPCAWLGSRTQICSPGSCATNRPDGEAAVDPPASTAIPLKLEMHRHE